MKNIKSVLLVEEDNEHIKDITPFRIKIFYIEDGHEQCDEMTPDQILSWKRSYEEFEEYVKQSANDVESSHIRVSNLLEYSIKLSHDLQNKCERVLAYKKKKMLVSFITGFILGMIAIYTMLV